MFDDARYGTEYNDDNYRGSNNEPVETLLKRKRERVHSLVYFQRTVAVLRCAIGDLLESFLFGVCRPLG